MGAKTEIAWTDSTWTPIRARVKEGPLAGHVGPHCERVSQGCVNCYSETNNGRCLPANGTGLPFNRQSRDKVDIFVDEKILTHPLHWKAARRIFVCSQTDLFGEWVTDEMIDRVFAVMALCPQHTFQVLTKREGRMQAWISAVHGAQRFGDLNEAARDIWAPHRHMFRSSCGISILPTQKHGMVPDNWPLPNVWLGVSCENERTIMERAGLLKQTPAALRFLSLEPLLGPPGRIKLAGISWVIVGGESGPGARPMHPDWARGVRDQCVAAGVPFFFKQWGEWLPVGTPRMSITVGRTLILQKDGTATPGTWSDVMRTTGDLWAIQRVGKKASGHLLDGQEWRQMPKVKR